jgi:hypothetical protein
VKRGWWTLNITGVEELNDTDREHVSQLVAEGFTSGEIVQEEEVFMLLVRCHSNVRVVN